MAEELALSGTSKLEAINYGLEPRLTSHGSFHAGRLLSSLQEGKDVVSFSGVHLRHGFSEDDTNLETYFRQPFLISKERNRDKEYLVIYPFNAHEGVTYKNRFFFDLSSWKIQVREEIPGANLHKLFLTKPGHYIFLDMLDIEAGIGELKTAILPRMPAGEIHQRYLEQLVEMRGLSLLGHEKKEYGTAVWHHQRLKGP